MDFLAIAAPGRRPRKVAYIKANAPIKRGAGVIWMSGFRSKMTSVKGEALAGWAQSRGVDCLRFDYSGHGQSEGCFAECVVGDWLAESVDVFRRLTRGPQVIAASSMGAWLALLLARTLQAVDLEAAQRLKGLVLLAPAWDMTEDLMWRPASEALKCELMEQGVIYRVSQYEDEPFPITRRFIEEGRDHLIGGTPFDPGCPIRILHGMRDADVPYERSLELVRLLQGSDSRLTLIKDSDHRLSGQGDLNLVFDAVEDLCGASARDA